jgi:hypothetical protein
MEKRIFGRWPCQQRRCFELIRPGTNRDKIIIKWPREPLPGTEGLSRMAGGRMNAGLIRRDNPPSSCRAGEI